MQAGVRIIDMIRRTNILGCYEELIRLAGNNAEVSAKRMLNLTSLLKVLKEKNNFYRPLLERFTIDEIESYPFVVTSNLPVTDKQLINKNFHEVFTPIEGRPHQKKKTGGSTGAPFYYYVDKEHLSWFWGHIYFFWNRFSGYRPGDPFVTIAGNSLRTANRQFTENIYHRLQNNYFIKGDMIVGHPEFSVSRIKKAVLLYGYPSSIQNMLKIKPGLPDLFSNLKAIFTTSEQLTPQTRKFIETAFKKPVFDMYGANDGGILTCECGEHNGYHINTLNCHAENIKNEHGMCEILLTNLNSQSFPFIRYRVGDLGKIENEPCKCGLDWPRIVDLKGRTRDLIKLESGGVIHGSYFNNIFYRFTLVDGYRIVQQKDYSIEVFIHLSDEALFESVASEIMAIIREGIPEIKVSINYLPNLNPTNDKFKLIVSHVD
ncbi:MAG: hypothetical protein V1775_07040 [Bacteroidota bacterium]